MALVTPVGARDFREPFNKNEQKWFRDITRRFGRIEPIAALDPVVFTIESYDVVVVADAPTQTASYVQADVQAIADLANANKVAVNDHAAKIEAQEARLEVMATAINQIIASLGDTPV